MNNATVCLIRAREFMREEHAVVANASIQPLRPRPLPGQFAETVRSKAGSSAMGMTQFAQDGTEPLMLPNAQTADADTLPRQGAAMGSWK